MLGALREAAYAEPTPVQAGLIPRALAGVDVLGQARTGTGKTASFVIPILERLERHKRDAGPQAIILVPTRELAVQVREEAVKLSHGRKMHVVALYGGKPIRQQIEKLKRGAEIVVGTPGRVLDHIGRGTLKLSDLRMVVLDEADRMLDIGFRPDIEKILRVCPQSRQTLLLSATVPPPVERLARRYMHEPESLNFSSGEVSVETIEQHYFTVSPENKFELLVKLLKREDPQQAIVFCRTKRGTDRVQRNLSKRFEGVDCIHGDLPQKSRDRVMLAFRQGNVKILVATDVVGRGIDVSSISHIINYDIPAFCDDYVHRVGRTGRMGREGVAYTFVTPEEGPELTRIEMRIERLLGRDEIPGFEAFAKPTGSAVPASPGSAAEGSGDGEPTAEPAPPAKPPLYGRGGRPIRRIRRAL
ncbi:MAG TPA: DEAD/DEAH box helicase [Pirellulales bacterium]|jgi:ATP-dependent RNA helicase DeaD|nr:DEAD/DEAH box helicase [Pirellulales bacterium]